MKRPEIKPATEDTGRYRSVPAKLLGAQSPAPARFTLTHSRITVDRGLIGLLMGLIFSLSSALASPPGVPITNQALVSFDSGAGRTVVAKSNSVEVVTVAPRSPSSLRLGRVSGTRDRLESVGPSSCLSGGAFLPLPVLKESTPLNPTVPRALAETGAFNLGETVLVRLDDRDQNTRSLVIDTAEVSLTSPESGDSETILLAETGPNTGIFAGYFPGGSDTAVANDCVLQGAAAGSIEASYADPSDSSDQSTASIVIDATAVVFNSQN